MSGKIPKIIVRMVASNSEETIARAIESILNQTYTNFEVHVIIRGSTDSTADIVQSYAEKDLRVRAIINKDNWIFEKGNDILDYYTDYDISRDYVCFMDGDDEYKPRFMEDMLAFAEENNLDIAACGTDVVYTDTGRIEPLVKMSKALIISGDDFDEKFRVYNEYMPSRWAKLIRFSLTDKLDRSRVFWQFYSDDAVEMLEYFRNADRIGIYPETFYKWYYSKNTVSFKWDSRRIESMRTVHNLTMSYFTDKIGHISQDNYEFLCQNYFKDLISASAVLICSDLPVQEKFTAMHEIIAHPLTRRMAEFSATVAECPKKAKLHSRLSDWFNSNEQQINNTCDTRLISEFMTALKLPGINKPDAITAAAWAVINETAQSSGALRILEISGYDDSFARQLKSNCHSVMTALLSVDRIDLTDGTALTDKNKLYNDVYESGKLGDIAALRQYDVIVVFHLFENTDSCEALDILSALREKAAKQVLLLTPQFPYDLQSDEEKFSNVRAYHPLLFAEMDFSYQMMNLREGKTQAYSFFTADDITVHYKLPGGQAENLKIISGTAQHPLKLAYIIPHHSDTPVMKDIYLQMKHLADRGSTVTAYYRSNTAESALPQWAGIIENVKQVIVPEGCGYFEHLNNEDAIILCRAQDVLPLNDERGRSRKKHHRNIPIILTEHGSPPLFGDYGRLIGSDDCERARLCKIYTAPVNLLATCIAAKTALAKFGRDAQCIPCGIDTQTYYPAEAKNNDKPVILLVFGKSSDDDSSAFSFALTALMHAYRHGADFTVQIVSQYGFTIPDAIQFTVEKITAPGDEQLARLMRNADIYLSCTLSQPFLREPLLAMASGTPVIAGECIGVNDYANPGVNCVLYEQGDVSSLAAALKILLKDSGAREKLALHGQETALQYSYENVTVMFEQYLRQITESG